MHHFLAATARRILASETPLRNILVILPSSRSAYHLKQILAGGGTEGILPRILTLNRWTEEVSGMRAADRLQLRFTCYDAYVDVMQSDAMSLSDFFSRADMLIDDFNDIETGGIAPEAIFKALEEYSEIEDLSFLHEPLSDKQKRYRRFWQSLKHIHRNFNDRCEARGEGYPGLITRKATERIDAYRADRPEIEIFAAGFNALSSAERSLLSKMSKDRYCTVLYDSDPAFTDDKVNRAGLFIRQNLASGLGAAADVVPQIGDRPMHFKACEARNKTDQADAAARILAGIPADEANDTALILADESLLIPVLNRLPANVKEANITMGISLRHSSFFDWTENLFDLHERMLRDEDKAFVISEQLETLVAHPFAGLLSEKAVTAGIADMKSAYTDLSAARAAAEACGAAWLSKVLTDWKGRADTAAEGLLLFAEKAALLLTDSEHSGPDLHMAGEGIATLTRFLRKLSKYPQKAGLDLAALRGLIADSLGGASADLIGEPAKGLQIMGLLESRGLNFRHIIMCDLNEEVIPGSPLTDSFIPFEIRAYHGMPGRREKEAVFAYYFYRLLRGCEKFWAIYHADTSGPWGAERSRYISQIEHYFGEKVGNLRFEKPLPPMPEKAAPISEKRIEKTPEVLDRIRQYCERGISASGINRFFESSLEWYYEHVLHLRTPEEEGQLSHADFGTVVHEILEHLYLPYAPEEGKATAGPELTLEDLKAMRGKVRDLTGERFRASERIAQFEKGLNRLQFETARIMVANYFNKEIEKVRGGMKMRVVACEREEKRSFTTVINGAEINARFKGYIDLTAEINGRLRVIDFKTGMVKPSDLNVADFDADRFAKKPKALQLMLYAWLARKKYSGRDIDNQIISLPAPGAQNLSTKLSLDEKGESEFESVLAEIIRRMNDPEVPLTADPGYPHAVFEPIVE